MLTNSLEENIITFKKLFNKVNTYVNRRITNGYTETNYCIMYTEGLINTEVLSNNIIKPLILSKIKNSKAFLDIVETKILEINGIRRSKNIKEIIESITYGETALFVDKYDEVLLLNTQKFNLRSINEPENEKILLGPREGFTEAILFNISMLHRKLRTNDFKVEYQTIGTRTNTKIAICYIDSLVKKEVLELLKSRLKEINIDSILDSNYIIELIKDNSFSPFRTIGNTERPDVVVGKMLEGRVALIVDGTPVVLTLPYLFIENFQSSEDYYLGFYYSSFSRMLRILGFFLTITVPALYIAVVAFHHEMIPTSLFISIAMERQSVPLPAAAEAFVMLIVFEILRETGVRMPNNIGQALSIVGALVIGQAAVEAKLVAAPMIIVIGMTGITSLLVPKMNSASIIIRFTIFFLASMFGLFGFLIALSYWFIHILNLHSFNTWQVNLFEEGGSKKIKDIFFRFPWKQLKNRPFDISDDLIRNNSGDKNG